MCDNIKTRDLQLYVLYYYIPPSHHVILLLSALCIAYLLAPPSTKLICYITSKFVIRSLPNLQKSFGGQLLLHSTKFNSFTWNFRLQIYFLSI